MVAIAVNEDGHREVLGAAGGVKEDKASWGIFFQWLCGRNLDGVKLVVGDKCLGIQEAVGKVFPEVKCQRCTGDFYQDVFTVTPAFQGKAVVQKLHSMKLKEATKKVKDGIEETLASCDFPCQQALDPYPHQQVIEQPNREIRRSPRMVGSSPDGSSALMLVCVRLLHMVGTQ